MNIYHFTVVITQDEDGTFVASVPELRGCHTQAQTLDELHERVKEVIELCMEIEKEKQHPLLRQKFVGVQQVEVAW